MAHLLHESLLLEVGREKQRIKAQRVERAERRIAGRLKDSVARKRSRMELEKAQRGDNRLDPRLDPFTRKDTRPQMLWDVPDDGACANGKAQPDRGRSVQTKTAKEKKKRRKAVTTEAVNLSDGSEGGCAMRSSRASVSLWLLTCQRIRQTSCLSEWNFRRCRCSS